MKTIEWTSGITLDHDSNASEIYRWNWAAWLGWEYDENNKVLVEGEKLLSQSIISDPGITATLVTLGMTYVDIRISGGVIGTTYSVNNRVTSVSNRIQDSTVKFLIKER